MRNTVFIFARSLVQELILRDLRDRPFKIKIKVKHFLHYTFSFTFTQVGYHFASGSGQMLDSVYDEQKDVYMYSVDGYPARRAFIAGPHWREDPLLGVGLAGEVLNDFHGSPIASKCSYVFCPGSRHVVSDGSFPASKQYRCVGCMDAYGGDVSAPSIAATAQTQFSWPPALDPVGT